jgi:hypothetical protein
MDGINILATYQLLIALTDEPTGMPLKPNTR